jgi:hypothetical protein
LSGDTINIAFNGNDPVDTDILGILGDSACRTRAIRRCFALPAKAEAHFLRALAVARQQQAKSWELRASMSLARHWRDQGKAREARELLA